MPNFKINYIGFFGALVLLLAAGLTYFASCSIAHQWRCPLLFGKSPSYLSNSLARKANPVRITLRKPDTVYLGGSRAQQSLWPEYHTPDAKSYNAAVGGATLYEIASFARHAVFEGGARRVFLSIPYLVFLRTEQHQHGFNAYALRTSEAFNLRIYLEVLEQVFAVTSLHNGRISATFRNENRIVSKGTSIYPDNYHDCKFHDSKWHAKDFEIYLDKYNGFSTDINKMDTYKSNMQHFENMLTFLQSEGIEVHLLVMPVHYGVDAVRVIAGVEEHYLSWAKDVVGLARQYNVESVRGYTDIDGVTDEAFMPSAECEGVDLKYWWNPTHLQGEYGKQLSILAPYGGPVSGSNWLDEEVFENYVRRAQERYHLYKKQCRSVSDVLTNCFAQ